MTTRAMVLLTIGTLTAMAGLVALMIQLSDFCAQVVQP